MRSHTTLFLAGAALLAGCGATSAASLSKSSSPSARTVAIHGYAYHPPTITVSPGTRLVFVNRDQTAHTASEKGARFDTGTIQPGHRAAITVSRPGRYTFYCQFHPFMHGTVIVR
jgi:plastocyanin